MAFVSRLAAGAGAVVLRAALRAQRPLLQCTTWPRRGLSDVAPAAVAGPAPTFTSLGVSPAWSSRLSELGLLTPTSTQVLALPALMARHSAVLHAETGTGKTLCYLLPILDALTTALASHDRERQLLPLALILVPSAELVLQVHGTAVALLPEHANIIRVCAGMQGVTRRQNAGILIATPVGLRDNVSVALLSGLQFVVFDEADALLMDSGAGGEIVRSQLLRMKRIPPSERPLHLFCAATMPSRGPSSVSAFLDKYYPQPDTLRLVSQGSHRPTARVRQTFWQIDTHLPLTRFERESATRLAGKVAASAANALEPSSAAAAAALAEQEGEEEEEQEEEEYEEGEGEGDSEVDELDALGRTMEGRAAEDSYLRGQEEVRRYASRLGSMRKVALLEALLEPARLARGAEAVEAAGAAEPATGPPTSKREGFRPSGQLGFLDAAPAPSVREERRERAEARRAKEEGWRGAEVEGGGDVAAVPPPVLLPFLPPALTRGKLTTALCGMVPPTLVFANTVEAASALRTFLSAACPAFRVSELHSKVPDAARAARVADFKSGAIRVLVATDLAARGLDTISVAHVVQADFAGDIVAHLHRVGRTARAGSTGLCTAIVGRRDLGRVRAILGAAESGADLQAVFSRRRSFAKRGKRSAIVGAEEGAIMSALLREAQGLGAGRDTAA
jgi:superfamily II DNA/RNA helicase